jgi:hypothetical protein
MRGFKPTVEHKAPQIDEIRDHIRKNQFVYGVVAGLVLANVLTRVGRVPQTVTITIPREKY